MTIEAFAERRKQLRFGGTAVAHLFTLAALLTWWGYSHVVPDYQLPGPWPVARRIAAFVTDRNELGQLGLSLFHVTAAIVIAFVFGCIFAALAHYVRSLSLLIENRFTPFLNAFSGIGWLFLAILWFGLDDATVIFAVTMILLPFTIINVGAGLKELDRDLIELGQSLTRQSLRRAWKITVPQLLPYLFAALRTSFGVSWKVVLTAELFGGNGGIGYILNIARQEFDTETIFAIIFFILIFVACVEIIVFRPIQRRLDQRFARA
ncbi:MAG TPA: ABC transporter permease subunit [Pseudolabrys sp.]|nr:ABC transporter permease subunit [Pseudolabrys sp.]